MDQEPWRGDAQRLLMFLYAKKGQRSRAIKQYETFRQILAEELDVTPSSETEELIKAIQAGEIHPLPRKLPLLCNFQIFSNKRPYRLANGGLALLAASQN